MTIRDIFIKFGYDVDKTSEKKANDSIGTIKSTATKLLGAIGIGFSLAKVNEVIEEFGRINAQVKNATEGMGEQVDIQNKILASANEARVAYSDIADLTSKLVQENKELFDVTNAAKFTELTTKLFRSEGKAQGEILALQEAINKSFAKGAIDSETINQILERSPVAADLLAKEVGGTRAELAKMAADGKISLQQLRDAFLGNADGINSAFSNVDMTISDALVNVRNQWGLWLTQMDKTTGISKTIANYIVKGFNQVMWVLRKLQDGFMKLSKMVGGVDRLMRLLAIAAGAIFLALNAGKIITFIRTVITGVGKLNLKVLALAAVFIIIALLIEDFINFMQGNDSLFGEMLSRAGFDLEEVRQNVRDVWDSIKRTLTTIWEGIKRVAESVFGALSRFWEQWGGDILKMLGTAFAGLVEIVDGVFSGNWSKAFEEAEGVAVSVFGTLNKIFGDFAPLVWAVVAAITAYKAIMIASTIATQAMNAIQLVQKGISIAVTAVQWLLNAAMTANPVGIIIMLVAALIAAFIALWQNNEDFRNFFIGLWEGIKTFFIGVWEAITGFIGGVVDWFKESWDTAVKFVSDLFEGFKNFVDGIVQAVSGFFTGLWEGLQSGFGAVVDFFKGAIDRIVEFFQPFLDIIGKVGSFISDGLGAVGNFFGGLFGGGGETKGHAKGTNYTEDTFIAGEEGPELITGARGRKVFTKAQTGDVFGTLTDIARMASAPKPETVSSVSSSVENKSIVQNIDISNRFEGDRAGQKKSAEAMDKAADDATGFLARSLAYVR